MTDEKIDVKEEDFVEFFGKSRAEVIKPMLEVEDENVLKRKLFKDATNLPKRTLMEIYEKSEYFTILTSQVGNSWFYHIRNMGDHPLFQLVEKLFPDPSVEHEFLDWGCGSGIYSLNLAMKGYNVTLADIPHPHFKFLQFLCKKYGIKAKFHEISYEEFDIKDKYSLLICTDVLEHTTEPEPVLEHLVRHLKDNGWLFLSTFFDDCKGNDPSHLKKNTERYNDYAKWLGRLSRFGLVCLFRDANDIEKGFVRYKNLENIVDFRKR